MAASRRRWPRRVLIGGDRHRHRGGRRRRRGAGIVGLARLASTGTSVQAASGTHTAVRDAALAATQAAAKLASAVEFSPDDGYERHGPRPDDHRHRPPGSPDGRRGVDRRRPVADRHGECGRGALDGARPAGPRGDLHADRPRGRQPWDHRPIDIDVYHAHPDQRGDRDHLPATGSTVGVGEPISIMFNQAIPAAAQRRCCPIWPCPCRCRPRRVVLVQRQRAAFPAPDVLAQRGPSDHHLQPGRLGRRQRHVGHRPARRCRSPSARPTSRPPTWPATR